MSASPPHPLDTDLLDHVEGTLPPDAARAVDAHLATCILCRIKHQRLSSAEPVDPVDPGDLGDLGDGEIPAFRPVETVDAPPATALPGDLWLTRGDEALMVLVTEAVAAPPGVVVVPVTFDTASADRTTLVLDATASPLGLPLAVHRALRWRLPPEALRGRVVPARDVDLLAVPSSRRGVRRGRPLEGPGDPRREVRQLLTDRLAALAPGDGSRPAGGAVDDVEAGDEVDIDGFGRFREQLADLHLGEATVEPFATPAGCPEGWVGLGQVVQRHLSILVLGTPAGLITDADYVAARGVAVRWHASALIVCPRSGATVELYTPKGLYDALQVPLGRRSPEPTVSGLDLADSVRKFFDLHPLWHVPAASDMRPVRPIDVNEVLERQVRDAAGDLARRAVRGAGKPEAYRRAAARADQLAALLQEALAGTLAPEDIAALVDQDRDPE